MTLPLLADNSFVIDEITAVVEGPLRSVPILASDTKRRSFDGATHTDDDVILEVLKDQRAEQLGVTMEKEDIDRSLRAMAHGEDVSPESLAMQAQSFGFDSLDEFYEALKILYRANSAMEVEVRSLLQVSEQEAREYAQQHPAYTDGIFYLQSAIVPFQDGVKHAALKRALEKQDTREVAYTLEWSEPFDIADKELAKDKDFIRHMHEGQVKAIESEQGFQVYKLKKINKPQVLTFDERRKSILNMLREEKFNTVFKKYNEDMLHDVVITRYS